MKKFLLMTGIICMVALSSVYAGDGNELNERAIASFNKNFVTASNVHWQQESGYAKATFSMNNQIMLAYYNNENGELIAIVRNILSDRLPINLMADLKNNYEGYWISSLFEMASEGETFYYVTLENENKTIVLKSSGFNTWTVDKKIRKN
jgi:hypothetical protein